jgi:Siphovirus Gp157
MTDVLAELNTWQALREHLQARYPEIAEEDLFDTLDGECQLTEALAQVIESAEGDRTMAAALEIRIDEMRQRLKRMEGAIERKREFVADIMETAGIKKLRMPQAGVSLTPRPPKVLISDEAALPPMYFAIPDPPAPRPDKRMIAEALKAGATVPGATLSNSRPTITIRRS